MATPETPFFYRLDCDPPIVFEDLKFAFHHSAQVAGGVLSVRYPFHRLHSIGENATLFVVAGRVWAVRDFLAVDGQSAINQF